jgi:glycosyltransferase involved in cell wall biosynthesis
VKVLFISSGNSEHFKVSPFIKAQGESLVAKGVALDYFSIVGKGLLNYLKNVGPLRRYLRENPCDIIHAHYSLCGWVAVLAAGNTPVVLSLMGDDAQGTFTGTQRIAWKSRLLILLTKLVQPFVQAIISKSENLEQAVYRKSISRLIPNGVQLNQFKLYPGGCREALGLDPEKQYVLFLGSTTDPNKNFNLVKSAVAQLNRPGVELLNVFGVPHDTVVQYLNSVDVFTLCSFGEGSPNVVKEAMTCNCPLVVTPAGDAAWVVAGTPGCFVADYSPEDFAEKLHAALDFARETGRTRGRERILELGLDAAAIADKLIDVYKSLLPAQTEQVAAMRKL